MEKVSLVHWLSYIFAEKVIFLFPSYIFNEYALIRFSKDYEKTINLIYLLKTWY